MSAHFRVLWCSCLVLTAAPCAEQSTWAGLRLAIALDQGSGPLSVMIDGALWNPQGLTTGEVTGLRRLRPGAHRLQISRDGLEPLDLRLQLKGGQTITLVLHAQRVEVAKGEPANSGVKQGDPAWSIRALKLMGQDSDGSNGRTATMLDVGPHERRLLEIRQVGSSWQPLALKRFELQHFSIQQHRGYLPLRVGNQTLNSLPVFEQGQHFVILYELRSGRVASLCYRDRGWPMPGIAEP